MESHSCGKGQPDKLMTEDELDKCKEEIQGLTKRFETKVNDMAE